MRGTIRRCGFLLVAIALDATLWSSAMPAAATSSRAPTTLAPGTIVAGRFVKAFALDGGAFRVVPAPADMGTRRGQRRRRRDIRSRVLPSVWSLSSRDSEASEWSTPSPHGSVWSSSATPSTNARRSMDHKRRLHPPRVGPRSCWDLEKIRPTSCTERTTCAAGTTFTPVW